MNTDVAADRRRGKCIGGVVLPIYFGANWGAERVSATESPVGDDRHTRGPWATGRVKVLWGGVLSVSIDDNPEWVEFQALSQAGVRLHRE